MPNRTRQQYYVVPQPLVSNRNILIDQNFELNYLHFYMTKKTNESVSDLLKFRTKKTQQEVARIKIHAICTCEVSVVFLIRGG